MVNDGAENVASREHVVVAGDNLWDLARHYDTSVGAIAAANRISRNTTLALGQRLRIPRSGEAPTTAPRQRYEVQKGDSLWTISRRFKVSVGELKRWNGLSGDSRLMPGDELVITPGGVHGS